MKKDHNVANINAIKEKNRMTVLNLIRTRGLITKTDLAKETNSTLAGVGNIIKDLLELNLIAEYGFAESTGGRKPIIYQLNANAYYAIGIKIGINTLQGVLINLEGLVVSERTLHLTTTEVGYVVKEIVELVNEISEQVTDTKILGVGVSAPGPLNSEKGIIISPPNLDKWVNVPLKELLEEQINYPVYVQKDANAAAYAELYFGNARNSSNFLYFMVEEGIGSGIIINHEIYHGFGFGAGEIGHTTIDVNGPLCSCGNYGCLEVIASGLALIDRAKGEMKKGYPSTLRLDGELTLEQIISASGAGDQLAQQLLQESARYVGIGLANQINILNPETVILGGSIIQSDPKVFETAKNVALARVFPLFANQVEIVPSKLGTNAEAIGGGTIVLHEFFSAAL